ncbi:hypothetical protein GCM10010381_49630 [Streptomyces xantholiticus]|nr:hypothetical protein GCM10010381_49630 [Streptomyces xantholiticus]
MAFAASNERIGEVAPCYTPVTGGRPGLGALAQPDPGRRVAAARPAVASSGLAYESVGGVGT